MRNIQLADIGIGSWKDIWTPDELRIKFHTDEGSGEMLMSPMNLLIIYAYIVEKRDYQGRGVGTGGSIDLQINDASAEIELYCGRIEETRQNLLDEIEDVFVKLFSEYEKKDEDEEWNRLAEMKEDLEKENLDPNIVDELYDKYRNRK